MNKKLTENNVAAVKPDELWLNIGGNPSNTTSNFSVEDAFIAIKIPNSQTSLVTKRINWESGKVFYPWKPGLDPTVNPYYCFYQNVMYLCLGNNPNNNEAESGDYLTSTPPTQKSVVPFSTEDGYTWISLWFLDYTKETFLTDEEIPLPEFGITKPKNTFTNLYSSVCPDGITTTGTCCLYYKTAGTNPITGNTYAAGSLVNYSVQTSCYECYELGEKLNYDYTFNPPVDGITASCDSSIPSLLLKDILQNNSSKIPPNTSNGYQLDLLNEYEDHVDGVMRVSIDLSGLTDDEKIVQTANPYLTIVDPHTTDLAVVRLKTVQLSDTDHQVVGIELVSTGKNHVLPSYTVGGDTTSPLNDVISLYDYPDKLFENPGKVLPVNSYIVNAFVNVGDLQNTTWNTKFTKIALSETRISRVDEAAVVYAPDETVVKNVSIRAKVQVTDDGSEEGPAPPIAALVPPGEEYIPPLTENDLDVTAVEMNVTNDTLEQYNFYISAIRTGTPDTGKNYGTVYKPSTGTYVPGYYLEINDLTDSSTSPVRVNDTLTVLGNTCTVFEVEQPELSKRTEYFSSGEIDLDINGVNPSVNLAFSIKVNT